MAPPHHRDLAGPIAASERPACGDITRSARHGSGDLSATTPQWGRVVAAAVAAAILGFCLPNLLARGAATGTPSPVCDRSAIEMSTGDGC